MSAITTHVLDTVLGKPAAGIAVRLEKQEGGAWRILDDGFWGVDCVCGRRPSGTEPCSGLT